MSQAGAGTSCTEVKDAKGPHKVPVESSTPSDAIAFKRLLFRFGVKEIPTRNVAYRKTLSQAWLSTLATREPHDRPWLGAELRWRRTEDGLSGCYSRH
jgi:hypothetical protein